MNATLSALACVVLCPAANTAERLHMYFLLLLEAATSKHNVRQQHLIAISVNLAHLNPQEV
jgi:hypothetical protein